MQKARSLWQSNLGFLLAAIGSAIGLGNIWRFSYMAHEYGGGAFLVPYLVALAVAGIPIILLEYGIGHREKGASPLAFARLHPRFELLGWWMPVVAMFGIMLYYSVVIGWCVNYFFHSFTLAWGSDPQNFFFSDFLQISSSPAELGGFRQPILLATVLVWASCWFICYRDIRHGIEVAAKVFMPLLLLLTAIIVFWTLQLEGAWVGIRDHYLTADWDKINFLAADPEARTAAARVWTAAFGQIFFTLSLGFGIMITYASYLPTKTNLARNALITTGVNCGYSIFAGLAVFGIVGFTAASQGVAFDEAIMGGPQLAFVVYPQAISLLPDFNSLFGALFFLVLIIAGLTSGVSLIEAFSCALTDKFNWRRKKVVTVLCLLGVMGSLIFTSRAGLYLLDITDHFITNYGLVLGGLLQCLIIGWYVGPEKLRRHISKLGSSVPKVWNFFIRYLTPLILLILLLVAARGDLAANYGEYGTSHLLIYGVGWLLFCLMIALFFTLRPWLAARIKHKHRYGDEDLLV
ncbi:sodium-dependent transporter [Desulfurivibrio dismutans]|uniref:sodium-dependent transporter n=1 Tax=Desulfurivibrio dismutans TaxID=1398908 RepID=UPI0023DAF9B7|nr:sodium-dependent transporter [Desulfurivibrio alkaliphilus]MDF1615032.1 sodium-dependent transporter [Desulfurivibrio alkaliphilus]